MKKVILLLLPIILFGKGDDEVDYVGLASILIRDGHYDRALETLQEVDLDSNSTDKMRFYTLRGVIHMKKENYYSAISDFEDSFFYGKNERKIRVYIAKGYFTTKNYDRTILALNMVPEIYINDPALISMKAQSHWKLGEKEEALETISFGISRFPDFANFYKQKFFYLIDLKLFQEAKTVGLKFLELGEPDAEDYLGIGNAFRRSGDLDEALKFLQIAQLKFPNSARVLIEMGHVYIDKDQLLSAAQVFEKASLLDNKYSQEASELYRRVKRFYHTLYLNAKIIDQKEKFKQRMALYLELGHFESAAAMEVGLSRIGLLEDENIRYALAFALSKIGKYDASEKHLKYITNSSLFKQATQLRASMADCRVDMWKCEL